MNTAFGDIQSTSFKINCEGTQIDLLQPVPATCVRLYLTSRCNLRCIYCAVSDPNWQHKDLSQQGILRAVEELPKITDPLSMVLVNGAGETTFLNGWDKICSDLIAGGLSLGMTTNLAKHYTATEIAVLAKFDLLLVSTDSFEDAVLSPIRRKVSSEQIIANIRSIQAAAQGQRTPRIRISCGLYDRSAEHIVKFAHAVIKLGIEGVTFWNLEKHHSLPHVQSINPLYDLNENELRTNLILIDEAISLMLDAGLQIEVAGLFLEPLRRACGLEVGRT